MVIHTLQNSFSLNLNFISLKLNTLHICTHPELISQNIYPALGEMQIEHSSINDVFIPYKTSCSNSMIDCAVYQQSLPKLVSSDDVDY
jgi:hypothetical protein